MHTYPIFMELSFDGTAYHGWQIQPNSSSVQGTIEDALTKLNGNIQVHIVGCGRTDTGVHAKQYFIHFNMPFDNLEQLVYRLNKILPQDIKIIQAYRKAIHARFDAKQRTYRYFIETTKNPFNNRFCWHNERRLSIDKMNEACRFLIGEMDFASFAKGDTDVKTTICTVFSAEWKETSTGYMFEVTANRFLRNMVRAMVGTLIEVGLGHVAPEEIKEILHKKSRQEAALSVPAKGLFLWQVLY